MPIFFSLLTLILFVNKMECVGVKSYDKTLLDTTIKQVLAKHYKDDIHSFDAHNIDKIITEENNQFFKSYLISHQINRRKARAAQAYRNVYALTWRKNKSSHNSPQIRRNRKFTQTHSPGVKINQEVRPKPLVKRSVEIRNNSEIISPISEKMNLTHLETISNLTKLSDDINTPANISQSFNTPPLNLSINKNNETIPTSNVTITTNLFTIDKKSQINLNNSQSCLTSNNTEINKSINTNCNTTINYHNVDDYEVNSKLIDKSSKTLHNPEPRNNKDNQTTFDYDYGDDSYVIKKSKSKMDIKSGFNNTSDSLIKSIDNSTRNSSRKILRKPEISDEMDIWVKNKVKQFSVISVPNRLCPSGQRLHRGRCVRVY